MNEFADLVEQVLDREGGYIHHGMDRGGPTNMGITQKVFSAWLSARGLQWRDVRSLTEAEAVTIYLEVFWKNSNCEALPPGVRDIHFDAAVNHGVRRAALLLQDACRAKQDGAIGPKTLHAVYDMPIDLLRTRYILSRYRFYASIVKRDRSQREFIFGWLNRMEAFA